MTAILLPELPARAGPVTLAPTLAPPDPNSLTGWVQLYWQVHVVAAPAKTMAAKRQDLTRFIAFVGCAVGHDHVDGWTPVVTRQFQAHLIKEVSPRTGTAFAATTVNRVLATLRHFGRWLHGLRPLLAGSPFVGVKDRAVDASAWNGLTAQQVLQLRLACEQRLNSCTRRDQDPLLEGAVFLVLLHTGLRVQELVSLNLGDYHHRAFHNVQRKGARVSKKVALAQEARDALDRYIKEGRPGHFGVGAGAEHGPLLMSRAKIRLTTRGVGYICQRLAAQACKDASDAERFELAPHQLRHTFLKRVADKHGIHVAHTLSGNISVREVFRYTRPSDDEVQQTAEELFR